MNQIDIKTEIDSDMNTNNPTDRMIPSLSTHNVPSAKLASDLRLAILTNQLQLTLQPKVCLKSFEICGYEVLLRWVHPTLGLIPADHWVAIAEKEGLMPKLTLWLVMEVARHQKDTIINGNNPSLSVAINVSPSCLTVEFSHQLIDILKRYQIPAHLIEVEITESTEITNFKTLAYAISVLRQQGIKVSLDDFGNGYASMRTLVELEVDEIKIDRSLVQSTAKTAKAILTSLVTLAHDLGLSVVLEGIETQQHLNLARTLGAHKGQGYLFGRPQLAHVFTDMDSLNQDMFIMAS